MFSRHVPRSLFLILVPFLALALVGCASGDGDGLADTVSADTTVAPEDGGDASGTAADAVADAATDPWGTEFEPHMEQRDGVYVLWLKGTPYEMGVQHAQLMREQLLQGIEYIDNSELGLLEGLARTTGYLDDAETNSYDFIKEECRGMADVLGEDGWTYDRCMALAYGDVVLEFLLAGQLACSQFVVNGAATVDGKLIHGRNLDWDEIGYLLDFPTVIVRAPVDAIPYVVVGFPGCVAPYNGINAAGIVTASNEVRTENDLDRTGRSNVQTQAHVLREAETLDEALGIWSSIDRMTTDNIVVSDGVGGRAAAIETAATHQQVRELTDGYVFATNQFVSDEMIPYYVPYGTSPWRFERLTQLVPPDGSATTYGALDVAGAIEILRDNYSTYDDAYVQRDLFSGAPTIANNGCIYSMVFVPEDGVFYMASGRPHVPSNRYVGFSVGELLGLPGAAPPDPPFYE